MRLHCAQYVAICMYMMCIQQNCVLCYLTIEPTLTLTTVSLLILTINRSSLTPPDPLTPPNSAALLSPTGVSVKVEHGGGGCPVMFGELHPPGGDDIKS